MLNSLHHRLVACICLAWVTLIAAILLTVYASDHELTEEANLDHLAYEAELIASQIEQSIDTRQHALEELSHVLTPSAHSGEDMQQLLALNRMGTAMFSSMGVLSEQGRVVAQYPNDGDVIGLDISHRQYFKEAVATRLPGIGDPVSHLVKDTPIVVMTHPMQDAQGQPAGILAATFDLHSNEFFNELEAIGIGEQGFASVMTSQGKIISHPDESQILKTAKDVVADSQLNMALHGWEGHGIGQMPDGVIDLHAFSQVEDPNWVVRTSMPMSQAAAPILHLQHRLWLIGILAILLMLPITWWLSRHILAPLHDLEAQILRIRDGQDGLVKLSTRMDEMQQLASSFNNLEAERAQARTRLQQREAFLNAVLDNSPIGIFIANDKGLIIYRNMALERITGYHEGPKPLSRMQDHVHPDDQADFSDLWSHAVETQGDFLRQARYRRADGHILWIEAQASTVKLKGELLGYAGIVKDITQRREDDAERIWEAEHDPLTGLLNRRGFERRLDEALAEHKASGEPSVLLFFDLDHFKPINDEGGHDLGDEMLEAVSRSMAKVCRRGDHLARPGGDEFAVILSACTLENAQTVAESLRLEVSQLRVMRHNRSYAVTLSLGMTPLLCSDDSISEPLKRADNAGYQAKAEGRNRIVATTLDLASCDIGRTRQQADTPRSNSPE